MEKDIGKIKKNDESDIIIRLDDFGGARGLTIREFVTSDRYTGFTKAGVRIKSADFPVFKELINSISEEDLKNELAPEQETLNGDAQEEPKAPEEKPAEQPDSSELPDY